MCRPDGARVRGDARDDDERTPARSGGRRTRPPRRRTRCAPSRARAACPRGRVERFDAAHDADLLDLADEQVLVVAQEERHVLERGDEQERDRSARPPQGSRGAPGGPVELKRALGNVGDMYPLDVSEKVSLYPTPPGPPSVPMPICVLHIPSMSNVPRTSRARSNDG